MALDEGIMADLETQLADQQARLQELHAAFGARLEKDAAEHKAKLEERDRQLNAREKFAADKIQLAIQLTEAVKERATALDRKEKELLEKHAAVRGALDGMVSEMEKEAAARATATGR
jgi:DNA repair exonuclease SbcCD ATPase subunit